MSDSDKRPTDTETILMALDQIGQTIDVMTSVVGRLRSYVQQREGRLGAWLVRDGEPRFVVLPEAQAGRPAAVDWPADLQVVDEGRFAIGLQAPAAAAGGTH